MNDFSTSLTEWLESPRRDRGISFLQEDGVHHFVSYPHLAEQVLALCSPLSASVGYGDRVAVILPQPHSFTLAFYACLHLGCTLIPLPHRMPFQQLQSYRSQIEPMLLNAQPSAIVTSSEVAAIIQDWGIDATVMVVSEDGLARRAVAGGSHRNCNLPNPALIQYTSGSTTAPKGVMIKSSNLLANMKSLTSWLGRNDDRAVTWLPMYHDMGLIGILMNSVHYQRDILVMTPEQFVARPDRWLDAMADSRGTITAAPPFGYGLALRRALSFKGDLSGWRVAICGAEPIDASMLRDFAELFSPVGFSPAVFCPAYGLAEGTLIVTGVSPQERPHAVRINSSAAAYSERIVVEATAFCDEIPHGDDSSWLVSCGRPLEGIEIEIRDEQQRLCPTSVIGEIWIRGASVVDGYWNVEAGDRTSDDWLRTNDAAFVLGDELYVVGRIADRVKVRGQSVYAEEIERRLSHRLSLRRGSIVALPALRPGGQGLTLLYEYRDDQDTEETLRALVNAATRLIGNDIDIEVCAVPKGGIPRTTSGKLKRREAWVSLNSQQLDTLLCRSSGTGSHA